jgi:hypothetical protein
MSFLIGTNSIPFSIICRSFDEVILRKKEKEDIHVANALTKRNLPVLDSNQPPAIQFAPFAALRARIALIANDSFAASLATEPGEDAMAHLIKYLLTASPNFFQMGTPPSFDVVFRKNDKYLTPALIKRLTDLPKPLAVVPQLHFLLRAPIQNALNAHKADADALFPLLWKFANVDEFVGRRTSPPDMVTRKAKLTKSSGEMIAATVVASPELTAPLASAACDGRVAICQQKMTMKSTAEQEEVDDFDVEFADETGDDTENEEEQENDDVENDY